MIGAQATSSECRRLVLWRHGRTEWNLVGRAQGHANVPLDEVGLAQARRAAKPLASYEPAFVWSSDLMRARQTAEALAALTGHEVVLDRRLREYDVGVRQGMTNVEFREAYPDVFAQYQSGEALNIPGQELLADVQARMLEVLEEATKAVADGETGVIVGHGAALRTGILSFFDGRSAAANPHDSDRQATCGHEEMLAGLANCAWAVLEEHPQYGWQIVDYNARNLPEPVSLEDSPLPR